MELTRRGYSTKLKIIQRGTTVIIATHSKRNTTNMKPAALNLTQTQRYNKHFMAHNKDFAA